MRDEGNGMRDARHNQIRTASLFPHPASRIPHPSSRSSRLQIIPIDRSHVSTSCGHCVAGNFVRRSPKAWPPCA